MLPENIRTGILGEHKAVVYLRKNGYRILSGNFRTSSGEIDVIAEDNENVCFIEVKTRAAGGLFPPSEAVDKAKEENVRNTAAYFMKKYDNDKPARFDILEVTVHENEECEINYIKNAF